MNLKELRESVEELPRDYVFCLEREGTKFYFSPMAHIIGKLYSSSPGELNAYIKKGRECQDDYREEGTPIRFPWPDDLIDSGVPEEIMREAVKSVEGVYSLWDLKPDEKILEIKLKGNVLDGKVRSKSAKRQTSATVYEPSFRNLFLGYHGDVNVVEMECGCENAKRAKEKGGEIVSRLECSHVATLLDTAWDNRYSTDSRITMKTKGSIPKTHVFNPFAFANSWSYNGRIYVSKDREFASLQVDMAVAKYVKGETHFEIDKKALNIPWIRSPTLTKMIDDGKVTKEVFTHGKRRVKSRAHADRVLGVYEQMQKRLYGNGYRFRGRCMEFGDLALHFENPNGNSVNVVVKDDDMYYVIRGQSFGRKDPDFKQESENPLSTLGKKTRGYDDRTMQTTSMSVQLPSAFRLPENGMRPEALKVPHELKRKWRRNIRKRFKGSDKALEYTGLQTKK